MYIVFAFAQRRKVYFYGAESVIEVFAETSFFDSFLHLYIGSSHNAHIGFLYYWRPYFDELAIFEHSQEAYLGSKRQFAHFV